jgi:hypothetical protein
MSLTEVKKELSEVYLFQVEAKLVFKRKRNLTKDIINVIRAFAGITVVDIISGSTKNLSEHYTSVFLRFKFIPDIPGYGLNLRRYQLWLLRKVKAMDSVSGFSYLTKPIQLL